jgi:hypothetical protein
MALTMLHGAIGITNDAEEMPLKNYGLGQSLGFFSFNSVCLVYR